MTRDELPKVRGYACRDHDVLMRGYFSKHQHPGEEECPALPLVAVEDVERWLYPTEEEHDHPDGNHEAVRWDEQTIERCATCAVLKRKAYALAKLKEGG